VPGPAAGVPVRDIDEAVDFHRGRPPRDPDVVSGPGIMEWKLTPGSYLQFFANPGLAGFP
jgi:hypothetical protein